MYSDSKIKYCQKFSFRISKKVMFFTGKPRSEGCILEDIWQHNEGAVANNTVLSNGAVFEKAAVNFSHVHVKVCRPAATLKRPDFANAPFQALGYLLLFIH